jgi:hypothetical protein
VTERILFERMDAHPADSHVLERYEATGGYRHCAPRSPR